MGQAANNGRNAALDNEKARAAGRMGRQGQNNSERASIRDAVGATSARGRIDGAFGKDGRANRRPTKQTGGGGGSDEEGSTAAAQGVGRSTRPAKKR